jgi:3-methyladenine DNA glycosylase AlkD
MINEIKSDLKTLANPEKVPIYQNFFKTGKGQYGEGDIFIGVTVPNTKTIAKKYKNIDIKIIKQLLSSKIHEERLLSLLILVEQFQKADKIQKGKIFKFYLDNAKNINNWDLVDLSADKIFGNYLFENKDLISILTKLAKSENLWERRISIISTFHFIKQNQFEQTLKISHLLLNDKHDLIHKAVGWMLREIGKRNLQTEECFLRSHYKKMPRTMLRYAIEKFSEEKRQAYLKGKI